MKKSMLMLVFLVGIIISATAFNIYAQPNIPEERIPSEIPAAINREIKKLYSDPIARYEALEALEKMGEQAEPAIPFLIGLLHDSLEIRTGSGIVPMGGQLPLEAITIGVKAANALAKIGEPAVVALIIALGDKDPNVRERAAYALAKIKDPRAVESLLIRLNDDVTKVRSIAALALGKIKDPIAVEPLIQTLKDKEPTVRMDAAGALGDMMDLRAVNPLIAVLKDQDHNVRKVAAWSLGQLKDPSAVETLLGALTDESPDVRRYSAMALEQINDPRAIKPLIGALKDDNLLNRLAVANALEKITGNNFGEDYNKWNKWWKQNYQESNIKIIVLTSLAILMLAFLLGYTILKLQGVFQKQSN